FNNIKHSNKINLTKKQLEIIGYICIGKTTAEISEIMKISPRTVEGHKYNIYKLTNTHNVVTLIIYAKENNIFY
ncbi:MAG: helix-turn-helix transcriptional regulator, partial [Bacteroidales bacterium]|nr:helix-turn-helix transcriptional regulator [Bacteroidales bacterium]